MAIFALIASTFVGTVLTAAAFTAGATTLSLIGVYLAPSVLCILYLLNQADA